MRNLTEVTQDRAIDYFTKGSVLKTDNCPICGQDYDMPVYLTILDDQVKETCGNCYKGLLIEHIEHYGSDEDEETD
jgi:hypothetical protein